MKRTLLVILALPAAAFHLHSATKAVRTSRLRHIVASLDDEDEAEVVPMPDEMVSEARNMFSASLRLVMPRLVLCRSNNKRHQAPQCGSSFWVSDRSHTPLSRSSCSV